MVPVYVWVWLAALFGFMFFLSVAGAAVEQEKGKSDEVVFPMRDEDYVKLAAEDLGVPAEDIIYTWIEDRLSGRVFVASTVYLLYEKIYEFRGVVSTILIPKDKEYWEAREAIVEQLVVNYIRRKGEWATLEGIEDAVLKPGMFSTEVRDAVLRLYAKGKVRIIGAVTDFDVPRWVIRRWGDKIPNWKRFQRYHRLRRDVDRNTGRIWLRPILRGDDAIILVEER